ncbi:hypothetical protein LFM56_03760 [Cellulomonas iranensis]|uniref:hypothetical protein n=1 Tax=Cellulomonas iranensis TaxID=76862 RepID=UPI001CF4172F|nr:hypothetical protein [Cellulomonas iranensis]UCN15454.1 hypothetical protein LFM56_03760 [Cellulomonas iranensis]
MHPPRVEVLHLHLEGWLGDDLLETFPCFVVTESLASRLRASGLTGFTLADVTISTSEEYAERHAPGSPRFRWLQVTGRRGLDDLWVDDDLLLHVSPEALAVLRQGSLGHAVVVRVDRAEGPA